ncbi:MAG: hydrogenase maturation protease [Chloroflexi bacterium]|nr:hydrogenase maturation protease [Chloroflexota bacterium]
MKKVVLGIGNPIIGDDGVAFHVIEALQENPPPGEVTLTANDVSGLAILDLIADYDEAIIVDAIQTVNGVPGEIYRLKVDDFRVTKHTISPHDVDLPTALDIGKILKINLPSRISIIAIEIPDAYEFSTVLTDAVSAAVNPAAQMAREILAE